MCSSVKPRSGPYPAPALVPVRADLRFDVRARRSDGGAPRRGIYLRNPQDAKKALVFQ